MYSGDEEFGDEVTSGIFPDGMNEPFEGELDQSDFEHEMEDSEDGL